MQDGNTAKNDYRLETAQVLQTRYRDMLAIRQRHHEHIWEEIGRFVAPRKHSTSYQTAPNTSNTNQTTPQVYDNTAIDSAEILAAGHSSAITPANSRWFVWAPVDRFDQKQMQRDEAKRWYNKASQSAYELLGPSNFYAAISECYDDRSAFGVCCLGTFPSKTRGLTFRSVPVGSFVCEENFEGDVDTVFVSRNYKIDQLADTFGMEVVKANRTLNKAYEAYLSKGVNSDHEVIHACFPRPAFVVDTTKSDVFNMPYADIHFVLTDRKDGEAILKRSGATSQIYMVSRYLTKSGGTVYGFSPYENVRASIQDAQKLRRILQVLAQRLALPPLLVPEQLVGNVDVNPGGQTVIPSSGSAPKEWMAATEPKWLVELLAMNQAAIKQAYHTDMFRMFQERTKQMTVREVSELASEKLMPFGPSFARFTSDFRVTMERVFDLLLREGVFGTEADIPDAVKAPVGKELVGIQSPQTMYQSRMALAYRNQEIGATDRLIERAGAIAQMRPDVLDNLNIDFAIRDSARGDGVPEGVLVPYAEVEAARKQAASQQQAQQAALSMLSQQQAQTGQPAQA